jgi:serine/threonine-protein kinase
VPAELARIITKLMAKDRDRRYQSPEQLVRDLLVIAGQLGLSVLPADPQLAIAAGHRITWERHLVWFFPALAFVVVVAGLVWWGRESNGPMASDPGLGSARPPRNEAGPKSRTASSSPSPPTPSFRADAELDPAPSAAAVSRSFVVRPTDDLLSVIASAPPRATITLSDDGPYLLGGRTADFRGVGALVNRDLTIKAESGVRPVLRFAADAGLGEGTIPALLPFVGGNVTVEGLTFEFDREGPDDRIAAISSQDTELTIRGCMFRQGPVHTARHRAALRLRVQKTIPISNDRPPAVVIDACHFDGGQVGIVAEGPADLLVRDCTMGPGSPSIWIDNSQAVVPVPAEVRVWNSSLIGGSGPVFEIEGTLARFLVNDTVIAPSGNSQATLVVIDNPRFLAWHGRANLYSRIRAFLEPNNDVEGAEAIDDFDHWKSGSPEIREVDSVLESTSVWNSPQPLQELVIERDNPTLAFQLAQKYSQMICGARQGPYGARLVDPVRLARRFPDAAAGSTARTTDRPVEGGREVDSEPDRGTPSKSAQERPSTSPNSVSTVEKQASEMPPVIEEDTSRLPAMPPMITTPAPEAGTTPAVDARLETAPPGAPTSRDRQGPGGVSEPPRDTAAPKGPAERGAPDTANVVRSTEQLVNQINQLGDRGGTITIARQSDLESPGIELAGPGQWVIKAQPGSERPRLRLRPAGFAAKPLSDWTVLFNLRAGSLHLEGLDLLVQDLDASALSGGRVAVLGVASGTRLKLTDCTITVTGRFASSAAVVVQQGIVEARATSTDPPARPAVVHVENSFLRCGGDGITVTPDRPLDLRLQNAVLATEGSLIHALGCSPSLRDRVALTVRLERSLTRTKGGLVYLECTPDESDLPVADIEADRSLVSTAGPAALFRVDGRHGQIERLSDRVRWKADRVAYDQISTYRRDQILQTGLSPRAYTRADWQNAFDPKDQMPVTDGVMFLNKLDHTRTAWSLSKDDLRLDPQGTAADRGPDMTGIPTPPVVVF